MMKSGARVDEEAQHPNYLLITILAQWQEMLLKGTSEYDVIRQLQSPPYEIFTDAAMRDPLLLFQTHFALYNALYTLRDQWLANKKGILEITGTHIQLFPHRAGLEGVALADPLREYYLNWDNFNSTQKQDVEDLLDQFWKKMAGDDNAFSVTSEACDNARAQLCIEPGVTLTKAVLKRHYRKRLHETHPDKGGKASDTREIVRAYTLLLSQCN